MRGVGSFLKNYSWLLLIEPEVCSVLFLPDLSFKLVVSALTFDKTGIRLMSHWEGHEIAMVKQERPKFCTFGNQSLHMSRLFCSRKQHATSPARASVPLIHFFVIFC